MDLKAYERIKFQLADLVRAGQLIAVGDATQPDRRWQSEEPWRNTGSPWSWPAGSAKENRP
jgi:hypothetical protein